MWTDCTVFCLIPVHSRLSNCEDYLKEHTYTNAETSSGEQNEKLIGIYSNLFSLPSLEEHRLGDWPFSFLLGDQIS